MKNEKADKMLQEFYGEIEGLYKKTLKQNDNLLHILENIKNDKNLKSIRVNLYTYGNEIINLMQMCTENQILLDEMYKLYVLNIKKFKGS